LPGLNTNSLRIQGFGLKKIAALLYIGQGTPIILQMEKNMNKEDNEIIIQSCFSFSSQLVLGNLS